jgi:hypothetical protein
MHESTALNMKATELEGFIPRRRVSEAVNTDELRPSTCIRGNMDVAIGIAGLRRESRRRG